MEDVAKINYLKRAKSGNYVFRRRVPDELKAIVGKREYKVSLKTSDSDVAKSKAIQENLKPMKPS